MPGGGQDNAFHTALPVFFDKMGQMPSVRKRCIPADLGQDDNVKSQPFGFVDGHDADNSRGGVFPAGQVFHAPDPFIQGNALFVHLFRLILPDGQAVAVEVRQFRPSPEQALFQFLHDGGVTVPFQQDVPFLPPHAFRASLRDEGPERGVGEQADDKGVSRHQQPAEEVQQVFSQRRVYTYRNVVTDFCGDAVVRQPALDDKSLVFRTDQYRCFQAAAQGTCTLQNIGRRLAYQVVVGGDVFRLGRLPDLGGAGTAFQMGGAPVRRIFSPLFQGGGFAPGRCPGIVANIVDQIQHRLDRTVGSGHAALFQLKL